jgi:hypothetical protein
MVWGEQGAAADLETFARTPALPLSTAPPPSIAPMPGPSSPASPAVAPPMPAPRSPAPAPATAEAPPAHDAIDLFYSCAPRDEPLREELAKHLCLLESRGVRSWHERSIRPGESYKEQIEAHLDRAHIVLLLVSADYIASDHHRAEMARALERHAAGHCKVIPVLLRPVAGWENAPFGGLAPLPRNRRPVTDTEAWRTPDDAFADVAAGLEEALSLWRLTVRRR